ncbi:MAG: hypothetical protein ACTHN5_23855 [Phycisphaerae bacterium]
MRFKHRFMNAVDRVAIPNITLYLIGFQVICYLAIMGQPDAHLEQRLVFDPAMALHGEWWRAITFLFLPPLDNPIFAFFAWYFFWLMGTALEANWGTARYNLYLLIAALATIGSGLVAYLLGAPGADGTNMYIGETVFLAFATLYPDFVIYIFFILPVKVKWLALLTGILLGIELLFVPWVEKAMLVAAVANYFIFFRVEIVQRMKRGRRHMERQVQRSAEAGRAGASMHRCVICGATEKSHPDYEFRYCSECGGKCYCLTHLREHQHAR